MAMILPPELEQFIQNQVASGKYTSVDEVYLAGIRLLEEQDRIYQGRFEELRHDVLVGIAEADRGELTDADTTIRRLQQKLQNRRSK